MPKIEFADEARRDIESIVAYTIENWGADQAKRYVHGLQETCLRLAELPTIGKLAEWLAPNLRSFPYQSHVIYYRGTDEGIVVIAIIHKRQEPVLKEK